MNEPLTWVIGSGGLLGSNVTHALREHGRVWQPRQRIPWTHPDARRRLAEEVAAFVEALSSDPWEVAWCAGSGTTTTAQTGLAEEGAIFDFLLQQLARRLGPEQLSAGGSFLASSAGGVSRGPPTRRSRNTRRFTQSHRTARPSSNSSAPPFVGLRHIAPPC